ncbi:MAG: hypothetical protein RL341_1359 [Pseudomonadota bacterium]
MFTTEALHLTILKLMRRAELSNPQLQWWLLLGSNLELARSIQAALEGSREITAAQVLRLSDTNRLPPLRAAMLFRLAEVERALPGLQQLARSGASENVRAYSQAVALQTKLRNAYRDYQPSAPASNDSTNPPVVSGIQPISGARSAVQPAGNDLGESIERGRILLGSVSVSVKSLNTLSMDSALDNVFRLVEANSADTSKIADIVNAFRTMVEQWRAGYVELASSVVQRVQERLRAKDPGFRFVNLNAVSEERLKLARENASELVASIPLETPAKTDKFLDNRFPVNQLAADPVLATAFAEMLLEQLSTRAEKWSQAVNVVSARAGLVGQPLWNPGVAPAFDGKPRLAIFVADDQPTDTERLRSLNRFAAYYGDSVRRVSLLDGVLPRLASNQPLILVGHHVSLPDSFYYAGESGLSVNFKPSTPASLQTWQSKLDKPDSGLLDARTVGLYLNSKGISPDYVMLVSCSAQEVARQLARTINRPVVTFANDVSVGHLGRLVTENSQRLTIRLYIPATAEKAVQRITPQPAADGPNTFRDFLRLPELDRQAFARPPGSGGNTTEIVIDVANPKAITIEQLDNLVRLQLNRWRTRGL